jgi:hypothetical protein
VTVSLTSTPLVTVTRTPTPTPNVASPTPTATVTPSVTSSVTPSASATQPQINVSGVPTTGYIGVEYKGVLSATGGNGIYHYSEWLNNLPIGLSIVGNTITGFPSTTGTFEVGLQVESAGMTDQEIITIVIYSEIIT